MEETIELKFPCGICNGLCTRKCSNCYKMSYCSVEHQKEDWTNHKSTCRQFPIQYKRINDGGKNILTASKRIQSGQLIFQETSLISGPFLRLLPSKMRELKHSCLSCYKELNPVTQYKCSKCQWALCDSVCEKETIHSDFECKIFTQMNILPLELKNEVTVDGRDIYSMITVLRTLLLRDSNPQKWQQILNLYSYPILRNINPTRQTFQKLLIKFIQDTCGLCGFDENTIARVGGIVLFNSRGNDVKDNYRVGSSYQPRSASFVFHDLSHLSFMDGRHSNCTIHQKEISKCEMQVEVYAKGRIEAGEKLNYTDPSEFAVLVGGAAPQYKSPTSPRQNSGLEGAKTMLQTLTQGGFFGQDQAEEVVRQTLDDGPH